MDHYQEERYVSAKKDRLGVEKNGKRRSRLSEENQVTKTYTILSKFEKGLPVTGGGRRNGVSSL